MASVQPWGKGTQITGGVPLLATCRILEEEDNLISAHRWQIEETMAIVRQEMTLLGQVVQLTMPPDRKQTSPCWMPLHAMVLAH